MMLAWMPGAWEHHSFHNRYVDACVMLYIKSYHWAVVLGVTMNCIISFTVLLSTIWLLTVNRFVSEVYRSVNALV